MRAIGSMGHTVMVSNLSPSCVSLIQMSTLNCLDLESVLSVPSVCTVCLSTDLTCDLSVPQVLSPWNAPTPLLRSWCLWELYCKQTLPLLSLTSYIV